MNSYHHEKRQQSLYARVILVCYFSISILSKIINASYLILVVISVSMFHIILEINYIITCTSVSTSQTEDMAPTGNQMAGLYKSTENPTTLTQ